MTLRLKQSVLETMKPWAEEAYPYEGCGVLLGSAEGNIRFADEFVPLPNILREKSTAKVHVLAQAADTLGQRLEREGQFEFTFDPEAFNRVVLDAAGRGKDVVGILHTHPDHPAQPSPTDEAQPLLAGWSNVIVKVDKGRYVEATSWYREEDGQPFVREEIEINALGG